MYLCLSSGSREGYSKDVVDTLAIPIGGEQQFRYDRKWVDPDLQGLVRQDALPANAKCLLCFIDLRGKPQTPFILPLREATLTRAIAVGTTYTLIFRLGVFRRPTEIRLFSDGARAALPNLHRFHPITGGQEPTGYLWADAGEQLNTLLTPAPAGTDLSWVLAWEEIVRDYINVMNAPDEYSSKFLDRDALVGDDQKFSDKSPFYVFYELLHLPDRTTVPNVMTQGQSIFKLAPGSRYELSFYQYHPTKSFPAVSLALVTGQSNIHFTGNVERPFSTRYDIKRFTFSTADVLTGFSASMLVSRIFRDEKIERTIEDFYLEYDVKGSKVKLSLYVLAIAVTFAAPQLVTLYNASPSVHIAIYIFVVISAIALALFTTMKDTLKLR